MAIPFYENEHASAASATAPSDITATATAGDQVDGPPPLGTPGFDQVDYDGPPPAAAAAPSSAATSEPPPSAEEQLLAWKMLALTMCKVLKQFCQQHKQTNGKPSQMTATVQIQPQSQ
ncbi:uncharacterized protein LOC111064780 [Drosophila obscura]|uniref:uncharacterized protein LOC111064780 n=1 Tax=Drosophila obscura TaxID=7282 RepID=UPI001BB18F0C|nr:uncharacterized protein LOC111064780 [Drosophila obscura]